jgi:hypothetical protein
MCLFSSTACRDCCVSLVPDYHIHCKRDSAVRLRDGRVYSCFMSASGEPRVQRKQPRQLASATSTGEEYYETLGGAQGVEHDDVMNSFGSVACPTIPVTSASHLGAYALMLQDLMDSFDGTPMVVDGHVGAFCVPEYNVAKHKVCTASCRCLRPVNYC